MKQITHPVSEYIKALREQSYPEIFSDECIAGLSNIERRLGDTGVSAVCLEIPMDRELPVMDYSVCVPTPDQDIEEYWLEMDYGTYVSGDNINPCIFYDAGRLRPGRDDEDYYKDVLPRLVGEDMASRFAPVLKNAVGLLQGRCDGLYQVGTMEARGEEESLRIYTDYMKAGDIIPYLKDIGYAGGTKGIGTFLETWHNSTLILNFDLFEDHVGPKIGINFSTRLKTLKSTDGLLKKLREQGLLLSVREEAIKRFLRYPPQKEPVIQNDLSHVKVTFIDDGIIAAKAYLQQTTAFIIAEASHYSHPWEMNLELTTACPLHCPQCYVSLNTGREMSLETALYWIRDAARCGVKQVNLSGGETLCYPHLERVLEECGELGLHTAIALSGAGASKDRIKGLIDRGVEEIYVSLNGSTEEVTSLTRDGYAQAMRLLALLQELSFDNICINWVMHRCNADDFPNMIKLCEDNHVKTLIILGFKPDSSGSLSGYPTEKQMRDIAHTVKKYKGSLYIDAEGCFSQLLALIHSGLFGNRNNGIERGCGAGRDGVSVTAGGRLTPCRHLNIPEKWDSISEYWEKSESIKRLREISSSPEGCCAECSLNPYCVPCMDVGHKLHGRLAFEMEECPLSPRVKGDIR
ncbi:MAG: radical SAM protein [Lachnospiraceae bacterium]|nr:radical SAM protein [Lachnospiraceae bacterium]